jgi:hypothetical protein
MQMHETNMDTGFLSVNTGLSRSKKGFYCLVWLSQLLEVACSSFSLNALLACLQMLTSALYRLPVDPTQFAAMVLGTIHVHARMVFSYLRARTQRCMVVQVSRAWASCVL